MKYNIIILCLIVIFNLTICVEPVQSDEDVLTLKEMCEKSTDIVSAEVITVKSFSPTKESKVIYTSIKLKIEECFKGVCSENSVIEIITYGGTFNGTTISIIGAPCFREGEKVFVFLKEWLSESYGLNYLVYGRGQGKFSLKKDKYFRDVSLPLLNNSNGKVLNNRDVRYIESTSLIHEINNILY